MDILPRREIRFRPQRPARASVALWEPYIAQAAQMPLDAALRLPKMFGAAFPPQRKDVTAAVRRYAKGRLFVRSDVDGRLVLTRRRSKAEAHAHAKEVFMESLGWPGISSLDSAALKAAEVGLEGIWTSARPASHDANGSPVGGGGGDVRAATKEGRSHLHPDGHGCQRRSDQGP